MKTSRPRRTSESVFLDKREFEAIRWAIATRISYFEMRTMPMTTMNGYGIAASHWNKFIIRIIGSFSFIIRSGPIFVKWKFRCCVTCQTTATQPSVVHQSQLFDMFPKLGNKHLISIIEKLKCIQSVCVCVCGTCLWHPSEMDCMYIRKCVL